MAAPFTVVGKAVATKRGHYPKLEGGSRIVAEGETFEVFAGLEKGSWFKLVEAPKPEAAPAKARPGPKGKPADDLA